MNIQSSEFLALVAEIYTLAKRRFWSCTQFLFIVPKEKATTAFRYNRFILFVDRNPRISNQDMADILAVEAFIKRYQDEIDAKNS